MLWVAFVAVEDTSHTTSASATTAAPTLDGDPPPDAATGEGAEPRTAVAPGPEGLPDASVSEDERLPDETPGFAERGRMRRRARFLRKARELAYRDLGGLVFDLHRFARRNDVLVLAKLDTIGRIDGELRTLETALAERRPVTVLREAGIAACPRCAAIHGSDDRFCPHCGLAMNVHAERPVAGPVAPANAAAYGAPPTPMSATTGPGAAITPDQGSSGASVPNVPAPDLAASPGTPPPGSVAPVGPAPAVDTAGAPREAGSRSDADQPTEIVRPPRREA